MAVSWPTELFWCRRSLRERTFFRGAKADNLRKSQKLLEPQPTRLVLSLVARSASESFFVCPPIDHSLALRAISERLTTPIGV